MIGIVKGFNPEKGMGFIEREGEEVFVHRPAVKTGAANKLKEGVKVTFKMSDGVRGQQAVKVALQ